MEKTRLLVAPILIFLVLASGLYAGEKTKKNSVLTPEQIEANLISGLKTDNLGLQISCAYYLGEMKSQRAVIPLMGLLRSGDCEGIRLIAALSLMKIGTEKSIHMIKCEAVFNDCERVRRMCDIFYHAYLNDKYGGFDENSVRYASVK